VDYRKYDALESYLFDQVGPRFRQAGWLDGFDFFCIIAWKANRAKSAVARRLLLKGHAWIEEAVRELTAGIASQPSPRHRMAHVVVEWGFLLPMTSAILTVLYP
jgi:hypothetical protein